MTKKELDRIRKLNYQIKVNREKLKELNEIKTSIPTLSDGEKVAKSSPMDAPYEKIVIMIADLEAEIKRDIYKLLKEWKVAVDKIDKLRAGPCTPLADVLEYRYLMGLSWEEVADKMGYTERHVHRLHKKALKLVEKL